MLQSLAEGFAIVGVMGVFGAFNSVVSHSELVQSTPRAFYEVGLVVVVALAFVPSTLAAIHDVREADRARTGGRVVRRGRLLRQVVPVLELGLERAVTLAGVDGRARVRARRGEPARPGRGMVRRRVAARAGRRVRRADRASPTRSPPCSASAARSGSRAAILLASSGTQRVRYRPRRMTRRRLAGRARRTLLAPVALALCSLAGDSSLVWFAEPAAPGPPSHVAARVARACSPLLAPVGCSGPPEPVGRRERADERDLVSAACRSRIPTRRAPRCATSTSRSQPGEVLLVVGASGSGKSTLLRAANGLVPHASGGRFGGDVVVFGRSTRSHHPRELADVVGFVAQDPESQFVVDHVERDLAFVLENLGFSQEAMRRRVEEMLDALGIAHLRDRDPATLSGGERQRCAIAGALAAGAAGAGARRADVAARPAGRRRRARRARPAQRRPRHHRGARRAPARARRAARRPRRARRRRTGRRGPTPSAPCSPTTRAHRRVTRLGRLLGWDPPPLTVRDARGCAAAPAGRPRRRPPSPPRAAAPGDDAGRRRAACASRSAATRGAARRRPRAARGRRHRAVRPQRRRARPRCCARSPVSLPPTAGAVDRRRARRVRAAEPEHDAVLRHRAPRARGDAAAARPAPTPTAVDALARRAPSRPSSPTRHPAQPLGRRAPAGRDRRGRGRRRARAAARRADARHGRAVARRARARGARGTPPAAARSCSRPTTSSSPPASPPTPSCSATARSSPTATPATCSPARCSHRRCCACCRRSSRSRKSNAELARTMSLGRRCPRPPASALTCGPVAVYSLMVVGRRGRVPLPVLAARPPRSPSQAHNGDAPLVAAVVGALVVARGDARGPAGHDERRDDRAARHARRVRRPAPAHRPARAAAAASSSSWCWPAPRSARGSGCCSACARWRCRPIVTGGIGPWLPFQMLALGWMGARRRASLGRAHRPPRPPPRGAGARGVRLGVGLPLRGDHEPVVLAVRTRRRARLAPRPRPRRDAAPLLAVLRGDVARLGRRRRRHQRRRSSW